MKSYLSLIPISTKVRKQQNRMTILCIAISVLLVTTIFSVADMFIRTESDALQDKHGNWHISLNNISRDIAEEISQRLTLQQPAGLKCSIQMQICPTISKRKKQHYMPQIVSI